MVVLHHVSLEIAPEEVERTVEFTPTLGHPAIVAGDFESAVTRLRDAGFTVEEADELWGERRSFAILPGGHRVEVMAAPPPPSG